MRSHGPQEPEIPKALWKFFEAAGSSSGQLHHFTSWGLPAPGHHALQREKACQPQHQHRREEPPRGREAEPCDEVEAQVWPMMCATLHEMVKSAMYAGWALVRTVRRSGSWKEVEHLPHGHQHAHPEEEDGWGYVQHHEAQANSTTLNRMIRMRWYARSSQNLMRGASR